MCNVGYPSASSSYLYTAFPVICIQILGSIFQADNASCTPENLPDFLMAYPVAKLNTSEFKVISLFYPTVKWKYKEPKWGSLLSVCLNTQQHVQHVQLQAVLIHRIHTCLQCTLTLCDTGFSSVMDIISAQQLMMSVLQCACLFSPTLKLSLYELPYCVQLGNKGLITSFSLLHHIKTYF